MKNILKMTIGILRQFGMIVKLAKNDFKAKYANSFLGIVWAYVQPLVMMLVMWFVFQRGFRSAPVENTSYILWYIPAYIPWIYFAEVVNSSANCMLEYSYLVKKVKFNIEILPSVKIVSALFVHLFFIGFIFFMYLINGKKIYFATIQCIYYTAALTAFGFGISMLVSSITTIFKDFVQIVNVIIQIGFWASPILWNPNDMSAGVVRILKINPMYYIIMGYRESFINGEYFWNRPNQTVYFWVCTLIIWILGCKVFISLRAHFADEV
jgi:hypothetical protein